MADSRDLALAFLQAHAAEAARVLESLPTSEASALFASIGPASGAAAMAAMLPTAAARILAQMPEGDAGALLNTSGTQSAVAVLRHMPATMRGRVLAGMPPASALAAQMLLGFPDDTVGAWMDSAVVAVPASFDVHAALAHLRTAPDTELDHIFVVDTEQHLHGCIGLHALLRADERAMLSGLIRPVATTLSVMMPIASARTSSLWEKSHALPVIDHDQRLIGVLRRTTLTRALRSRHRGAAEAASSGSVAGALAGSYWDVVSGLSTASLGLLPTVKRVQPEEP
jgi:magnesium transporter